MPSSGWAQVWGLDPALTPPGRGWADWVGDTHLPPRIGIQGTLVLAAKQFKCKYFNLELGHGSHLGREHPALAGRSWGLAPCSGKGGN